MAATAKWVTVAILALFLLGGCGGSADEQANAPSQPAGDRAEAGAENMEEIEKIPLEKFDVTLPPKTDAAPGPADPSESGLELPPPNDLLVEVGRGTGRVGYGRAKPAPAGPTGASEPARPLALDWLVAHQMPDGGWSFNLGQVPGCQGKCDHSGSLGKARNAATALALLPFLGAGQTHKVGRYQDTVKKGLDFLVANMKDDDQDGSLWEAGGTMYSHGLASIVLCEAYSMTKDKALYQPAQRCVNFICRAQDPVGGGWRYQPRQAGDTSVSGWQLLALKSGHLGYLQVPPLTLKRAFTFLDSVQSNDGANYSYLPSTKGRDATTAIGLLCRMHLGWKKDRPALQRGVKWLSEQGPSKDNLYYNFYATQVMFRWGGDEWNKWNEVMRDQLIDTQVKEGHQAGSWYVGDGDHGAKAGGRLYCTSMAALILEVYYRHLPIYRTQATEEKMPE